MWFWRSVQFEVTEELPGEVRLGANTNAFVGGVRLWDVTAKPKIINKDHRLPLSGSSETRNHAMGEAAELRH